MLWIKAFHIVFMVTWFAGLFYLPRLFVYHTMCEDQHSRNIFKTMEYKLYYYITTLGAVLTAVFGVLLIYLQGWEILLQWQWLQIKLIFVILLIAFHLYCGKLVKNFTNDKDQHSEKFYRIINEIPVIPLIVITLLAVVKPLLN